MSLRKFSAHVGMTTYTAILVTIGIILWLAASGVFLFLVGIAIAILWNAVSLVQSSSAYGLIFSNAEATATLVSVVITGLFGFGGIILTNLFSARTARKQADENDAKSRNERRENERLARDLQVQIAKGLDHRIKDFSDAFARYHAETLAAIRRD